MKKALYIIGAILIFAAVMKILGGKDFLKTESGGLASDSIASLPLELKLGNQVWMSRNLDVDTFRNGDVIPQVQDFDEWKSTAKKQKPAWCYFNNDPENGKKYGKLYNWYAVSDPRGLAPEGWHIPSDAEWTALESHIGSWAGEKIKSETDWIDDGGGTNDSGFTGLPGGARDFPGAFGENIGSSGNWWTSSQYETYLVWIRFVSYSNSSLVRSPGHVGDGYSVRCVKNR